MRVADEKTRPFALWTTSSPRHGKPTAHTGKPQPYMSSTFIGRSSPEVDVCRQTPLRTKGAASNGHGARRGQW